MADLSGAVDLSEVAKTLGPRESEALQAELRMMAQTRELALRRQVELEAENDGLNRLLATLVALHGESHPQGGSVLALTEQEVRAVEENFAGFAITPSADRIELRLLRAYPGHWNVTKREPTGDERSLLDAYEELPEVVTSPEPRSVILSTAKGLRIAEWQPA